MATYVPTDDRAQEVPDVPDSILQIATELFWRQGFAATTTRQIAAAAGMRQASLYYPVRCKEVLIYHIVLTSLSELEAHVAHAVQAAADPDERIQGLIQAHLITLLKYQKHNLVVLMRSY